MRRVQWDYSGATAEGDPITLLFEAPGSSSHAMDLPTATIRNEDDLLRGDATGLYALGYANDNASLVYSDPRRVFAYPCSYLTTWTDDFSGVSASGSSETGTTTGTADGTGTLILPYGPVDNVLRVHVQATITAEYPDGTPPTTDGTDIYYYFRPGVHWAILTAGPTVISGGSTRAA